MELAEFAPRQGIFLSLHPSAEVLIGLDRSAASESVPFSLSLYLLPPPSSEIAMFRPRSHKGRSFLNMTPVMVVNRNQEICPSFFLEDGHFQIR